MMKATDSSLSVTYSGNLNIDFATRWVTGSPSLDERA